MATSAFTPPLTEAEARFLTRWAYDEWHFQEGPGPAKRLQVKYGIKPYEVAEILGATGWKLVPREAAGDEQPAAPVEWPWSTPEELRARVRQAREINRRRRTGGTRT